MCPTTWERKTSFVQRISTSWWFLARDPSGRLCWLSEKALTSFTRSKFLKRTLLFKTMMSNARWLKSAFWRSLESLLSWFNCIRVSKQWIACTLWWSTLMEVNCSGICWKAFDSCTNRELFASRRFNVSNPAMWKIQGTCCCVSPFTEFWLHEKKPWHRKT